MNPHSTSKPASSRRLAFALIALTAATITTQAAAPALNGGLSLRPLTPQEKKDYALPTAQLASGLNTVGLGQPVYLDALVNNAVPAADITNIVWLLNNTPVGSTSELAASPLGTNVPPYKIADRRSSSGSLFLKVADRRLLRPDVAGQYTVRLTIATASSGTTNLTQTITAGTYMGIQTCALCHSGGIVADNIVEPWHKTLHAHAFEDAVDGISTDHFGQNCISCHVVGFDANTNAVNGGWDDIAKKLNWTLPPHGTNGNWAAMPAELKNVSNIQCESCHGPGSQHAFSLGSTNTISVSMGAGSCNQCHDSLNHHYKAREWENSRHAVATRTPSGPTRTQCVRCHTASGIKDFLATGNQFGSNTVYEAITCQACHDPHDATNPHQLRTANIYTLPEGTTITNAGLGALCMTCHHSRNGSAETNIVNYQKGLPTWAGGSSFGVHDSTAGDMVEGVNGYEYGKFIPSGAHSYTVTNVCVGCHMQPVASTDPAFTKAGGHTFSMTYNFVTNGVTTVVDKVDVCVKCHGPIQQFDMVRKDYDGDGVINGIQTEVQNLLNRLSTLLPNSTYQSDPSKYVADGLVKTPSVKTNWPTRFLYAAWNWQFVNVEGSHGIHNAPYAIGLLKASISDLTGDSNEDLLPDSWQVQYFGSATDPKAAPNASPAGDGIPNWLKYNLGLDPTIKGTTLPGGVVWANGKDLVNSTNNSLVIYTAAEVVFDTVANKTYQIQGISGLGGVWQNIGSPIPGTGTSMSYVTPTRTGAQQFFRVLETP